MHAKVFEIMVNGGFLIPKSKKTFLKEELVRFLMKMSISTTFTSEDFNDLIENWLRNTKKELKLEIMQEN